MFISRPAPEVVALTDAVPLPGIGFLPVNAYVLYAREPVLIDTGLRGSSPEFLEGLWSLIEPADLRWVVLTHPDRDHSGSVPEILNAASRARLVTTSPGMGLLTSEHRIPSDRLLALHPGESLDVGDRRLLAFRPPFSDSPAKMGLIDDATGSCFSSDGFGAPVTTADFLESDDIGAVPEPDLVAGQRLWAAVDSPWPSGMGRDAFLSTLLPLRDVDPPVVLSSHLPAAHHKAETLLDTLANAQDARLHLGPDQAPLQQMFAEMAPTRS